MIDELIQMVRMRRAFDQREAESIALFLEQVPGLDEPFDERAGDVHVTASAIVVSDEGDKVALHLHKRLGMWLQPGGHIDPGETPSAGALREAVEETGLPVRHETRGGLFVHLDVHPGPKGHTHHDVRFLLRAPEVGFTPAEGESPDVKWFSWTEAEAVADAGLIGALGAVKALLGME